MKLEDMDWFEMADHGFVLLAYGVVTCLPWNYLIQTKEERTEETLMRVSSALMDASRREFPERILICEL